MCVSVNAAHSHLGFSAKLCYSRLPPATTMTGVWVWVWNWVWIRVCHFLRMASNSQLCVAVFAATLMATETETATAKATAAQQQLVAGRHLKSKQRNSIAIALRMTRMLLNQAKHLLGQKKEKKYIYIYIYKNAVASNVKKSLLTDGDGTGELRPQTKRNKKQQHY